MQRFVFQGIFLLAASLAQAQQPILVTEQELDLEGKTAQVLCYHFAEGDQVLLDVAEAEGKTLEEVALVAAPGETRWSALDVAVVEGEKIQVPRAGVHMLRIVHGRGGHRHVHVRITRVPRDARTAAHETAVQVAIRRDSVFELVEEEVVVGSHSVTVQQTQRINSRTEYKEDYFMEQKERLVRGEKRMVSFDLPEDVETRARDEKVVGWAYWIGVGEESNLAWEQNKALINKAVKLTAGLTLSPLGALAAGLVTELALPPKGRGEDVIFKVVQNDPSVREGYHLVANGAGVSSYRKVSDPALQQGTFGVFLENDNLLYPIDVDIRVSAYIEVKYWHEEYTDVQELRPVKVRQTQWRFIGML